MHALSENNYFRSPIFATEVLGNSKWCLKLYPFEILNGIMGIEIEKIDGVSETLVEIIFFLLTSKGQYYLEEMKERKFDTKDTFMVYLKDKSDDIFKDGSVFSMNDTLILKCHLQNKSMANLPSIVYSSLTQFRVEKHSFNWILKSKDFYKFLGEKIIIPKFPNMPQMKLLLFSKTPRNSLIISFEVVNGDINYKYRLKCTVSLSGSSPGRIVMTRSRDVLFSSNQKFEMEIFAGLFECKRFTSEYILNFDVIFSSSEFWSQITKCNYEYTPDIENGINYNQKKREVSPQNIHEINLCKSEISRTSKIGFDSLMDDLSLLLSEKKFSDVTIEVGGREFVAHKAILSTRSPVFNTMFGADMKEKETGVVHINDVDSEMFELFLKYLYLGKLDNITEKTSVSLYSVADKYQVMSLKSECSSFILNHLSPENLCDVLILSDMHQDDVLKNAAQEVFRIHSKNIFLSKDWVTLLQERPILAAETLQNMALRMQ